MPKECKDDWKLKWNDLTTGRPDQNLVPKGSTAFVITQQHRGIWYHVGTAAAPQFTVNRNNSFTHSVLCTTCCTQLLAHVVSWISKTLWGRCHSTHFKIRDKRITQVTEITHLRPKVSGNGQNQNSNPGLWDCNASALSLKSTTAFYLTSAYHCQYRLYTNVVISSLGAGSY